MTIKTANLIINGQIDIPFILDHLNPAHDTFCADGAYNTIHKTKIPVKKILGDLDSIHKDLITSKCLHLPDQDYTDYEKSIQYLQQQDYTDINIYGSLPGQTDHFLAALSDSKKYYQKTQLIFHTPEQTFYFLTPKTTICTTPNTTISIIPFPRLVGVTTTGLKYPLKNQTLKLGGLISVRNQSTNTTVTITKKKGEGIVIILKKDQVL